jgi:two-component system LytT family response regulator
MILFTAKRKEVIQFFHLDGKRTVMVSKSLIEYDNLLHDTQFIRIHKSFLINLHHVKEYQRGEGGHGYYDR